MKRIVVLVVLMLLTGCNVENERVSIDDEKKDELLEGDMDTAEEVIVGYISIDKSTIHIDEVEYITDEDTDRIEELGLTQDNDMPSGYYIYNISNDSVSLTLSQDTRYNFFDWGGDFTSDGEDRNYSTMDIDEFIEYLNTYEDKAAKVPFWVEFEGDSVISITEQFVN